MINGADTRARLLESASEVFAEQGYRHAKVREICHRAQANVAAVNYYFRDKEQLYMAVVDYAVEQARPQTPHANVDPTQPASVRLERFVRTFLENIFTKGHTAWYGKIIANETNDPTPALDVVVEKLIRPMMTSLCAVVAELLDRPAEDETVNLCASSIISQCVMYHNSREIIRRLNPEEQYDRTAVERMSEHIIRFSLAGLQAYAAEDDEQRASAALSRQEDL